jgi:TolB protein
MSSGVPVASGVQAPASAIPWVNVGPGWFLALWGPHAAVYPGPAITKWEQQKTTLFLVDPDGGRYLIDTLPAPSLYQLYDWSGDGRRALIGTPTTGAQPKSRVEEIDLASGKVLSQFTSSGSNTYDDWYQFTRPKGLALLRSSQDDNGVISLARLSLTGETQQTYPSARPVVASANSALLPSLDGTELVVAADHGLELFANNGTFLRGIGPLAKACSPERWWGPNDLVASCVSLSVNSSAVPALWLVPVNGPAPSQLTFPKAPDYGDVNGWKVGNAVYLQALGACGTEFLARRLSNGATKQVNVPKAANDERVIGASGGQLALQAVVGCGGGQSLFLFDPTTAKETALLGPPLNGGGVLSALPYPGLQS